MPKADPADDVEGTDAAYKLAILSTLAFRTRVSDADVHREGITRLRARDFLYARELGYTVKLMAIARKMDASIQARVHPVFVPAEQLIAKVDGVLNAVEIETDLAGRVLFHGRGAGALPTSSALVADIVDISRNIVGNVTPLRSFKLDKGCGGSAHGGARNEVLPALKCGRPPRCTGADRENPRRPRDQHRFGHTKGEGTR